jgi:hypothetical protein
LFRYLSISVYVESFECCFKIGPSDSVAEEDFRKVNFEFINADRSISAHIYSFKGLNRFQSLFHESVVYLVDDSGGLFWTNCRLRSVRAVLIFFIKFIFKVKSDVEQLLCDFRVSKGKHDSLIGKSDVQAAVQLEETTGQSFSSDESLTFNICHSESEARLDVS